MDFPISYSDAAHRFLYAEEANKTSADHAIVRSCSLLESRMLADDEGLADIVTNGVLHSPLSSSYAVDRLLPLVCNDWLLHVIDVTNFKNFVDEWVQG